MASADAKKLLQILGRITLFGSQDSGEVESSADFYVFPMELIMFGNEAAMTFSGHDDANNWLRRDYRAGRDIEVIA